jgi:DNA invertase Pin-like site-specific DNA recombinase
LTVVALIAPELSYRKALTKAFAVSKAGDTLIETRLDRLAQSTL